MEEEKIIISEIRIAEQNSMVVQEGEAGPGDFYNFDNGQVLATGDLDLDVLLLNVYREYEVYKKKRYSHSIPFTEEEKKNVLSKDKSAVLKESICFHLLLQKEIEEKKSFPYLMVFSRTNLSIGKDLDNFLKRMAFNQRPFFDIVLEFSRKKREGKDYFYYQKTWKEKRPSTEEEKEIALKWIEFLNKKK